MTVDQYCREIETYLCRKNGGHLIRIVGPAFEQVRGWAEQGVPLAVALRGIDRCCERRARRGTTLQGRPADRPEGRPAEGHQARPARPVRIEFCADDVLEAFDEWRRAVGIAEAPRSADQPGASRRASLPAHLDRVAARLSTVVASKRLAPALRDAVERALEEIDALRGRAKGLRGEARGRALDRLRELDAALVEAARGCAGEDLLSEMVRAAEIELAPFAGRMAADAWARATAACRDRLLRDHQGLPEIQY